MAATLEPIASVGDIAHAWIVRAGPAHEVYADPYDFACVAIRQGDATARLEGVPL